MVKSHLLYPFELRRQGRRGWTRTTIDHGPKPCGYAISPTRPQVPKVGVEPTLPKEPDLKSGAAANYATSGRWRWEGSKLQATCLEQARYAYSRHTCKVRRPGYDPGTSRLRAVCAASCASGGETEAGVEPAHFCFADSWQTVCISVTKKVEPFLNSRSGPPVTIRVPRRLQRRALPFELGRVG